MKLNPLVHQFFNHYLPHIKGVSPYTVCAYRDAFKLFLQDPQHPSLRFKRIHSARPIFSVRITIDYRALGIQEGDVIFWFWIGGHEDYDKLLSK